VTSESLLRLVLIYVALHFMLYVVVLRHHAAFGHEATIFGYHFWSAMLVSLGSLLCWLVFRDSVVFAAVVAAVCIHGVYSISFLELWSLSEGGYSLSVLRLVKHARDEGRTIDRGALLDIGNAKKGNRVQGLLKLRLVRRRSDHLELTTYGRVTASAFASVAWAANLRDVG
jgi:hypothetical protein